MPARLLSDQDHHYTTAQVSKHNRLDDMWITYKGSVYDVTKFVQDHPGGQEVFMEWAGRDVTTVMSDPDSHQHSPSAYLMLEKYKIGLLTTDNSVNSGTGDTHKYDNNKSNNNNYRSNSNNSNMDPAFLDLKQPLIWQLLTRKGMKKEYYLEQVHIGRHLDRPARLFHNPVLERLSHTPWWVIPTVWTPMVLLCYQQASQLGAFSAATMSLLFVAGLVMWTVMEYVFHRFLFHMDDRLPTSSQTVLTVHFLIHGVHHFLPMDKERLVMPPALMCILSGTVWAVFSLFLPRSVLYGLFSGGLFGYILYDMLHYYSHHGVPPVWALRWLKRYHLEHHYFDPHLGFGVSSPVWDWVFGTAIPMGAVP